MKSSSQKNTIFFKKAPILTYFGHCRLFEGNWITGLLGILMEVQNYKDIELTLTAKGLKWFTLKKRQSENIQGKEFTSLNARPVHTRRLSNVYGRCCIGVETTLYAYSLITSCVKAAYFLANKRKMNPFKTVFLHLRDAYRKKVINYIKMSELLFIHERRENLITLNTKK